MGQQIKSRANPIKLLGKSCVRSCVRDVVVHSSFGKSRVVVQSKRNIKIMIICTQLRLATMEASEHRDYLQNYREDTISMKNRG